MPIVVAEAGRELAFSYEEMLRYHGGGSPGGVAHAYKLLERALPLLAPHGPVERRSVRVRTAFGGPGARDALELVLRAVTGDRLTLDRSLARPERGFARERFVFELSVPGAPPVLLGARDPYVPDELITLARAERSPADDERFAAVKQEVAALVLRAPAAAVYERL